ncbi:receptor-like protein kinase [Pyrus ussuriensis x Pyrus communis]|uniref:Receptor-like protein kinase n=1 Tax=Pyrus ussuriensis x Pyrus communis TaxID=2448454 RepID=A0A5N5EVY6_9ROSA|nr:receptor-like protein kinase [Pyrus ussuriensis x Pyrus communis]
MGARRGEEDYGFSRGERGTQREESGNRKEGDDLRIHIGEEGDGKIPKQLAIVGLWYPMDHPSMKTVVQMLGGGENLRMPPNPFVFAGLTQTSQAGIPKRRILELEAIAKLE